VTTTTTTPPSSTQSLERRLGPIDGAAVIVSNVIGGGILFFPVLIAANVPDATLFLSTWLVGGALAFCGAMGYAELAALRPRAGGEYVYLREAYGSLVGFLTGWTSFVAGFAGAIAANAIFFVLYLDRFFPGVNDATPFFAIPVPYVGITISRQTLMATAVIWAFAFIHIRGVGPGRVVVNVLAAGKVAAFLIFVAFGLSMGVGESANLGGTAGTVTLTNYLSALVFVMFTYSGWNAAAYMAEEVRNPGRNLPLALALGTAAVVLIYLLINALYLYVIPIGELTKVQGSLLDRVADGLLGEAAGNTMGLVSLISLAASISAMTFVGPRVYFAMARDGVFIPAAAQVHPRYATPARSIVAQSLWATTLVLTGSLDALGNYVGFAITLFAGIAVAAVFVLRSREPDAPRPFRAIGYPFTPAIFVLASLAIVVNAIISNPRVTGLGLLVILAGIPIYFWYTRKNEEPRTKH
jgi:basic amino acid/polyamine antiporter, APA family